MSVTVPSSVTNISTAFEIFIGTYNGCHTANPVYESIDGVLYLKNGGALAALPKGISTFTMPATMTEIPANMFRYCTNLTSVTLSGNLRKIGNNAFQGSGITSFNFQSSLVEIGNYAFSNTKLESVQFANNANLTTLGSNIFSNCHNLKTADLSGLGVLGVSMFQSCDSIENVTFNSELTKIPNSAFSGCTYLQSITIPNNVTEIGNNAFTTCSRLQNVNLPNSLILLDYAAFQNDTSIVTLNIPKDLSSLPVNNFSGNAFTGTRIALTVDEENPKFSAENGILFNKNKTVCLFIPAYKNVASLVLPATVDTIKTFAFSANNLWHSIKKLTLPFSLRYIEDKGLHEAAALDTLIVKAIVPPVCANNLYSLNNDYRYGGAGDAPIVIIPPKTKNAYRQANGWKNYYGTNINRFVVANQFYDVGLGYAQGISPNGNYVVGANQNGAWLWSYSEGGTISTIPNSLSGDDVNDAGMIVGFFADNNYIVEGTPLSNGGVYRNGRWYSLGLGRFGNTATSHESMASPNAITADGDVYGLTMEHNNFARVSPFIWKYNAQNDDYITDTLTWAAPFNHSNGDQGGRFLDVSSDGTVAAGWVSRRIYGGGRAPIIWTSPTNYILVDEDNTGDAPGVSPNGKYIATAKGDKAAIYEVETGTLTVFGVEGSKSVAVSDNGFVVGIINRGEAFEAGRQAFIWSERLGLMNMLDFITEYCPDIVLPDDPILNFSNTEARFDEPMSISADGLVISGWSGYTPLARKSWIICIADTLELIDRPHNLQASVNVEERNKVNLSWSAPTDYGSHALDIYYIYRDGEKIGQIEPYEGTSFVDENVSAGTHHYSVSAIYDYVSSTNKLESGQSDLASVIVVDSYDIPFYENFEYGFAENYWNSQTGLTGGWLTYNSMGFTDRVGSVFLGSGNRQPYDYSLTSKPLDANGANKVMLSYIYRINSDAEQFFGIRDTIKVEISRGAGENAVWQTVQEIVVRDITSEWLPVTLDVSQFAADTLFRVRFRAVSGDNRNFYNFIFDDLGVAFEENNVEPTGVIAYRYEGDDVTHVIYKDRTGAYSLTHAVGQIRQAIGNEGNPFIAAQKFDTDDLLPLKEKYLTSISAYVHREAENMTPTQLKLAIWVNGTRVENGAIASFKGNSWNTFKLATPILIQGNETIIAGIEVAQHDALMLPLAMDNSDSIHTDVKGNLLSYDDGQTWINPSIAERFHGMWIIAINVRDEATAQTVDKDEFEIAYQIKRGSDVVATLKRGQHYVDRNAPPSGSCYTAESFRVIGGMSPESAQGCEQILNDVKNVEFTNLNVYPNPATSLVHIDGDFNIVNIYDEQGRLVLSTDKKDIDVKTWINGIYLFRTTLVDGKTAMAKVIVK
jgi:hypothetical protein